MKTVLILCFSLSVALTRPAGAQEPANPNAHDRARAVLKYFQSLESRADQRLVSGQFANFGRLVNLQIVEEIHRQTGHWPALLGVDYLDNDALHTAVPNRAAIDYWNQGGLVSVSAHLYSPARTNEHGGLRDKGVDLASLLATNSETHGRWMRELDQLAGGLQELQQAGVVVLWRPFHEMNGNWFWWGAKEPETFIRLWRHMFDYFTKTKGLNNLLWVYGPNHGNNAAAYYPGDAWTDLIGIDAYTDFIDTNHIKGYAEMAPIKKPFGFTEYGPHAPSNPPGDYDYMRFLDGIRKHFPRTVFFMSWNAKWSLASNTNVAAFLGSPWVVNRDDLPKGLAGPRGAKPQAGP